MAAVLELPLTIIPLFGSFEGQRLITLPADVPLVIGRLIDPNESYVGTLRFTSKVVSRRHAQLLFHDKKVYIQDIKSSSGTFLNDERLSQQGVESQLFQLHSGDIVRLGEDCEVNGVMHQSVCMKVIIPQLDEELVSPISGSKNRISLQPSLRASGDNLAKSTSSLLESSRSYDNFANLDASMDAGASLTIDTQFKYDIENEFNAVWASLTHGLDSSVRKLKALARAHASTMMTQGIYTPYSAKGFASTSDLSNPRQSMQSFLSTSSSNEAIETARHRMSRMPPHSATGSRARQTSALSTGSTPSTVASMPSPSQPLRELHRSPSV
ncbi:hypothetical protein HK105_202454 [Polyrhizophydium stewartii]|uniref:FHA domain-containing protein n=1 Tax=Polyrhizophydium stewartii TaxID=2732419 RepID=A0ABR4NEU2_9FUNG